jgi:hypothetical protein
MMPARVHLRSASDRFRMPRAPESDRPRAASKEPALLELGTNSRRARRRRLSVGERARMTSLVRLMLVVLALGIGGVPAAVCQWSCAAAADSCMPATAPRLEDSSWACGDRPSGECGSCEPAAPACASPCATTPCSGDETPDQSRRCCDCRPCFPAPRVPAPARPTIDPPVVFLVSPPWSLVPPTLPQMRVALLDGAPARPPDHATRQAILCIWVI